MFDQTEKKLSVFVAVEEERMFCKHIHFLPIKYSCKYYAKLNWKWGKIKTIFCGFIQTLSLPLSNKTMRINFWINSKVHNQTIITKVEIKRKFLCSHFIMKKSLQFEIELETFASSSSTLRETIARTRLV